MKKPILAVLLVLLLAGSVQAAPRVVAGVLVDDGDEPAMTPAEGPGGSVSVAGLGVGGSADFDDVTPCFFLQTVPVTRTWYRHHGVSFKGPNLKDGAAILDECSSFGVTGHSAPNFLAFNCAAVGELANGGTPVGPETIVLATPAPAVQISVGSGPNAGELVRFTARNSDGRVVATSTVTLAAAMQDVFLTGSSPIKKVVIDVPAGSSACAFVIDEVLFGVP